VILGHVLGARNGDTAAVSRGGAAGFTGIFQIVAADKAGGGRLKKGPICAAGHRLLPPSHPSPPLLPDLPSPSLLAQEGERAREWWSTIVSAKPTIPTSPVCCPLWPGTTRQQGRWRHRADRGIAIGARNSLRFGTAELGHQANVSLCIDGRCCRSMPRAAIQYASPVSRRLARRYVRSRRCDRAGAILGWRRRRCSSTACSVAAVGQCSAPPSPKSGHLQVTMSPATLLTSSC